jgi:hypothetical protein
MHCTEVEMHCTEVDLHCTDLEIDRTERKQLMADVEVLDSMRELERAVVDTHRSVAQPPFSGDGNGEAGDESHPRSVESRSSADHSYVTAVDPSRTAIESPFAERISLRFALRSQRVTREWSRSPMMARWPDLGHRSASHKPSIAG